MSDEQEKPKLENRNSKLAPNFDFRISIFVFPR